MVQIQVGIHETHSFFFCFSLIKRFIFYISSLFCGFTWLTFFVNSGLRRAVFEAGIGGSWDESIPDTRYPMAVDFTGGFPPVDLFSELTQRPQSTQSGSHCVASTRCSLARRSRQGARAPLPLY